MARMERKDWWRPPPGRASSASARVREIEFLGIRMEIDKRTAAATWETHVGAVNDAQAAMVAAGREFDRWKLWFLFAVQPYLDAQEHRYHVADRAARKYEMRAEVIRRRRK